MSGSLRDCFLRWFTDGFLAISGWLISFRGGFGFFFGLSHGRYDGGEWSNGVYGLDLWKIWISYGFMGISCADFIRSDGVLSMALEIYPFHLPIRCQVKEITKDVAQIPDLAQSEIALHRIDGKDVESVWLLTQIGKDLRINGLWVLWFVYFGLQISLQRLEGWIRLSLLRLHSYTGQDRFLDLVFNRKIPRDQLSWYPWGFRFFYQDRLHDFGSNRNITEVQSYGFINGVSRFGISVGYYCWKTRDGRQIQEGLLFPPTESLEISIVMDPILFGLWKLYQPWISFDFLIKRVSFVWGQTLLSFGFVFVTSIYLFRCNGVLAFYVNNNSGVSILFEFLYFYAVEIVKQGSLDFLGMVYHFKAPQVWLWFMVEKDLEIFLSFFGGSFGLRLVTSRVLVWSGIKIIHFPDFVVSEMIHKWMEKADLGGEQPLITSVCLAPSNNSVIWVFSRLITGLHASRKVCFETRDSNYQGQNSLQVENNLLMLRREKADVGGEQPLLSKVF